MFFNKKKNFYNRFKRVFSYSDVQKLWEVFWTGYPCKNFYLVFCLALLNLIRSDLIQEDCDYAEILKRANNLAGNVDLEESLKTAYEIYIEFANDFENLPPNVKTILDLNIQRVFSPSTANKTTFLFVFKNFFQFTQVLEHMFVKKCLN